MTTLSEQDTYVSSVHIEASFDTVWDQVTDPLNFPEMYPAWTTEVEKVDENTYYGTGPGGDEFVIRPDLNQKFGIVDFTVEADQDVEQSRSRLFNVDENACVFIHLAVRWDKIADEEWETHKQGTDDDLERMKRIVETM
jgi:hypothetical protein